MGHRGGPPGERPGSGTPAGCSTHNSAQTLLPASGYGIAVVTNTGMISGDDAVILTDGLIDIIEGRPDAGAVPLQHDRGPLGWAA